MGVETEKSKLCLPTVFQIRIADTGCRGCELRPENMLEIFDQAGGHFHACYHPQQISRPYLCWRLSVSLVVAASPPLTPLLTVLLHVQAEPFPLPSCWALPFSARMPLLLTWAHEVRQASQESR